MVSDNCFDRTGAASAGLPGLTIGEQIGGMWKSIAIQPSSGDSAEGVMTSILTAANMVVEPIFANADPLADATAPTNSD
uniref:3' exoribonuclease domain 1-containing family protein n=1 Tax=Rhizophora mucronata TaxID=61149 RepID=A0A2P2JZT8_RHIMU